MSPQSRVRINLGERTSTAGEAAKPVSRVRINLGGKPAAVSRVRINLRGGRAK
ncbi:hypothetical protein GCM10020000_87790 [Streptomyces olivoverticillatus]